MSTNFFSSISKVLTLNIQPLNTQNTANKHDSYFSSHLVASFTASTVGAGLLFAFTSVAHAAGYQSVDKAIAGMMTATYSKQYDKNTDCYLYQNAGEEYCYQVIEKETRSVNGKPTTYVIVSGDMTEDFASRVTPGKGGLFVFEQRQNGWELASSAPALETGGGGYSQLDNLTLSQVGESKYGWTGKFHGSGAGGESNSIWVMYAPLGEDIKEVANIDTDHYYEGGFWVDNTGEVTILSGQPGKSSAGFYSLSVHLSENGGEFDENYEPINSSEVITNYTMVFDPTQQHYVKK